MGVKKANINRIDNARNKQLDKNKNQKIMSWNMNWEFQRLQVHKVLLLL